MFSWYFLNATLCLSRLRQLVTHTWWYRAYQSEMVTNMPVKYPGWHCTLWKLWRTTLKFDTNRTISWSWELGFIAVMIETIWVNPQQKMLAAFWIKMLLPLLLCTMQRLCFCACFVSATIMLKFTGGEWKRTPLSQIRLYWRKAFIANPLGEVWFKRSSPARVALEIVARLGVDIFLP